MIPTKFTHLPEAPLFGPEFRPNFDWDDLLNFFSAKYWLQSSDCLLTKCLLTKCLVPLAFFLSSSKNETKHCHLLDYRSAKDSHRQHHLSALVPVQASIHTTNLFNENLRRSCWPLHFAAEVCMAPGDNGVSNAADHRLPERKSGNFPIEMRRFGRYSSCNRIPLLFILYYSFSPLPFSVFGALLNIWKLNSFEWPICREFSARKVLSFKDASSESDRLDQWTSDKQHNLASYLNLLNIRVANDGSVR